MSKPFSVVFYYRKPRHAGNFSIEFLFNTIQQHLPSYIRQQTVTSKYSSNGLWNRIYNTVEASFRQGDVNHVTGDVHFLTLLMKKRKTVLTVHDCGFMKHPSAMARFVLRLFWLKLPVACSEVVTVVSQATKDELLSYINCPAEKVVVVPNFISEKFFPAPRAFNDDKPVLLQIGTAFNKNLDRLIEAIAGIRCHLDIIGRISQEQINRMKELDIEFSNSYNLTETELIDKYLKCDLLTFVSTYEGFGMPILEAQTVERPVVTSNLLSMPDVAGGGACLVDPFDVAAVREGILKVIHNEAYRNGLIIKGRENVKRFSLQSVVDQYAQIYENIAQYTSAAKEVRELVPQR